MSRALCLLVEITPPLACEPLRFVCGDDFDVLRTGHGGRDIYGKLHEGREYLFFPLSFRPLAAGILTVELPASYEEHPFERALHGSRVQFKAPHGSPFFPEMPEEYWSDSGALHIDASGVRVHLDKVGHGPGADKAACGCSAGKAADGPGTGEAACSCGCGAGKTAGALSEAAPVPRGERLFAVDELSAKSPVSRLHPVILSGGSGTRLWPLSRGLYPKQFMPMGGETLFEQTVARAARLPESAPPLVVCNNEHRFFAAAAVRELGALPGLELAAEAGILLEPVGRNTAPAVALGAMAAMEREADPLLLVLSSDHIIEPHASFAKAVQRASEGARQGLLAVFGVAPDRPESGYGYIGVGEELDAGIFKVGSFVEKPDLQKAGAMLEQGGYLWNSGMFLFKAGSFLEELKKYAPDVYEACLLIWEHRSRDMDFIRFREEDFAACPSISVDYAVMEHTGKACVVPLEADWSDMGSWQSYYENTARDEAGNARVGDVIQLESRDCYLHSGHRLVAVLGLENLAVVESPDAVLVLPRERSQDVKLLTEELKRLKRPETDSHLKVYRPWGSFESISSAERFQVKRLIVNPGGVLSLQKHHHRAEHWVVVRGTARVTVNDKELILREDESAYIPLGATHRLENPGRIPLEVIEIQTGSYLGEDDIVRFEDTYGRAPEK